VAIAALWLVRRSLAKRKNPGCGGDCACPTNELKAKLEALRSQRWIEVDRDLRSRLTAGVPSGARRSAATRCSALLLHQLDDVAFRVAHRESQRSWSAIFTREVWLALGFRPAGDNRGMHRRDVRHPEKENRVFPDLARALGSGKHQPHPCPREKRQVRPAAEKKLQAQHVAVKRGGLGHVADRDRNLSDVRQPGGSSAHFFTLGQTHSGGQPFFDRVNPAAPAKPSTAKNATAAANAT